MKKILLIMCAGFLWFGSGAVGAGFFLAELRAEFPRNYKDADYARRRRNHIVAAMAVPGPIALVGLFAVTRLGSDGWTWTAEPTK